ncbi:MAG TPA: copper resistance system multicopper oxidase, partial [Longimicrobiales bacterium]|nr:copper resistance system multicopper oxidase [Longimicrobiales bacterium]
MPPSESRTLDRRTFLRYGGTAALLAGLDPLVPPWARIGRGDLTSPRPAVLDGSAGPIDLVIGETPVRIGERTGRATTINGTLPGPVLRFRQGDEAVIRVTNDLEEDTSLHWHGILLPNGMDGVPEVTYPGIRPGQTFEYRYPVHQYGTYWYHSHSGFQEQLGQYGALIIDPADPEPFAYDRDYVVVLSDWTFEDPGRIMARLRKQPDYYNFQKRTVGDFFRDAADQGFLSAVGNRLRWGGMRMSPTDISDVTGATYTYLVNGMAPDSNWTGIFESGERVRLRFINASAASYFDVRIPGLPLTVVQASGQHVQPVETDEFRIAVAETYDVIVEPRENRAWTIFAEAMDRSGFARGTLAPREGMEAEVPERRPRPTLTMEDMGMGGMAGMAGAMGAQAPGAPAPTTTHGPDHHGPANAAVAMMARSRLDEPGRGLGGDGWRVLRYTDLQTPEPREHLAPPEREIEIHLTGNMERFLWSMDGRTYSESEP